MTCVQNSPARLFGRNNNNVSGNLYNNAHNIHYSFDIKERDNSKFCFTVREAIDSYEHIILPAIIGVLPMPDNAGKQQGYRSQTIVDSTTFFIVNPV